MEQFHGAGPRGADKSSLEDGVIRNSTINSAPDGAVGSPTQDASTRGSDKLLLEDGGAYNGSVDSVPDGPVESLAEAASTMDADKLWLEDGGAHNGSLNLVPDGPVGSPAEGTCGDPQVLATAGMPIADSVHDVHSVCPPAEETCSQDDDAGQLLETQAVSTGHVGFLSCEDPGGACGGMSDGESGRSDPLGSEKKPTPSQEASYGSGACNGDNFRSCSEVWRELAGCILYADANPDHEEIVSLTEHNCRCEPVPLDTKDCMRCFCIFSRILHYCSLKFLHSNCPEFCQTTTSADNEKLSATLKMILDSHSTYCPRDFFRTVYTLHTRMLYNRLDRDPHKQVGRMPSRAMLDLYDSVRNAVTSHVQGTSLHAFFWGEDGRWAPLSAATASGTPAWGQNWPPPAAQPVPEREAPSQGEAALIHNNIDLHALFHNINLNAPLSENINWSAVVDYIKRSTQKASEVTMKCPMSEEAVAPDSHGHDVDQADQGATASGLAVAAAYQANNGPADVDGTFDGDGADEEALSGKIFAGNIDYKATWKCIKDFFGKFGQVAHVQVVYDPITKLSKGIAFVRFEDPNDAERCIVAPVEDLVLDGRQLRVDRAYEIDTRTTFRPVRFRAMEEDWDEADNWIFLLPDVVWRKIFTYLSLREQVRLERVSKGMRTIALHQWDSRRQLKCTRFTITNPLTERILGSLLQRCSDKLVELDLSHASRILTAYSLKIIGYLCPQLLKLDISGMGGTNTKALQALSETNKKLRWIRLVNCYDLCEKGLWYLLHNCQDLRYIDLSNSIHITGECFGVMGRKMKTMVLNDCRLLHCTAIVRLAERQFPIEDIRLQNCTFLSDRAFDALMRLRTLKKLVASGYFPNASRQPWRNVCQLVHLQYLDVAFNRLISNRAIDALVAGCPQLRFLNLSGCRTHITADRLMELAKLRRLQYLNLSYMEQVNCVIADYIGESCPLLYFILRGCPNVTDVIGLVLQACPTLRHLDISGNFQIGQHSLHVLRCLPSWDNSREVVVVIGGTNILMRLPNNTRPPFPNNIILIEEDRSSSRLHPHYRPDVHEAFGDNGDWDDNDADGDANGDEEWEDEVEDEVEDEDDEVEDIPMEYILDDIVNQHLHIEDRLLAEELPEVELQAAARGPVETAAERRRVLEMLKMSVTSRITGHHLRLHQYRDIEEEEWRRAGWRREPAQEAEQGPEERADGNDGLVGLDDLWGVWQEDREQNAPEDGQRKTGGATWCSISPVVEDNASNSPHKNENQDVGLPQASGGSSPTTLEKLLKAVLNNSQQCPKGDVEKSDEERREEERRFIYILGHFMYFFDIIDMAVHCGASFWPLMEGVTTSLKKKLTKALKDTQQSSSSCSNTSASLSVTSIEVQLQWMRIGELLGVYGDTAMASSGEASLIGGTGEGSGGDGAVAFVTAPSTRGISASVADVSNPANNSVIRAPFPNQGCISLWNMWYNLGRVVSRALGNTTVLREVLVGLEKFFEVGQRSESAISNAVLEGALRLCVENEAMGTSEGQQEEGACGGNAHEAAYCLNPQVAQQINMMHQAHAAQWLNMMHQAHAAQWLNMVHQAHAAQQPNMMHQAPAPQQPNMMHQAPAPQQPYIMHQAQQPNVMHQAPAPQQPNVMHQAPAVQQPNMMHQAPAPQQPNVMHQAPAAQWPDMLPCAPNAQQLNMVPPVFLVPVAEHTVQVTMHQQLKLAPETSQAETTNHTVQWNISQQLYVPSSAQGQQHAMQVPVSQQHQAAQQQAPHVAQQHQVPDAYFELQQQAVLAHFAQHGQFDQQGAYLAEQQHVLHLLYAQQQAQHAHFTQQYRPSQFVAQQPQALSAHYAQHHQHAYFAQQELASQLHVAQQQAAQVPVIQEHQASRVLEAQQQPAPQVFGAQQQTPQVPVPGQQVAAHVPGAQQHWIVVSAAQLPLQQPQVSTAYSMAQQQRPSPAVTTAPSVAHAQDSSLAQSLVESMALQQRQCPLPAVTMAHEQHPPAVSGGGDAEVCLSTAVPVSFAQSLTKSQAPSLAQEQQCSPLVSGVTAKPYIVHPQEHWNGARPKQKPLPSPKTKPQQSYEELLQEQAVQGQNGQALHMDSVSAAGSHAQSLPMPAASALAYHVPCVGSLAYMPASGAQASLVHHTGSQAHCVPTAGSQAFYASKAGSHASHMSIAGSQTRHLSLAGAEPYPVSSAGSFSRSSQMQNGASTSGSLPSVLNPLSSSLQGSQPVDRGHPLPSVENKPLKQKEVDECHRDCAQLSWEELEKQEELESWRQIVAGIDLRVSELQIEQSADTTLDVSQSDSAENGQSCDILVEDSLAAVSMEDRVEAMLSTWEHFTPSSTNARSTHACGGFTGGALVCSTHGSAAKTSDATIPYYEPFEEPSVPLLSSRPLNNGQSQHVAEEFWPYEKQSAPAKNQAQNDLQKEAQPLSANRSELGASAAHTQFNQSDFQGDNVPTASSENKGQMTHNADTGHADSQADCTQSAENMPVASLNPTMQDALTASSHHAMQNSDYPVQYPQEEIWEAENVLTQPHSSDPEVGEIWVGAEVEVAHVSLALGESDEATAAGQMTGHQSDQAAATDSYPAGVPAGFEDSDDDDVFY